MSAALQWFYRGTTGEPAGPYTIGEFRQLARQGVVAPETRVFRLGMSRWTLAGGIASLFNAKGAVVAGVIAGMPDDGAGAVRPERVAVDLSRVPRDVEVDGPAPEPDPEPVAVAAPPVPAPPPAAARRVTRPAVPAPAAVGPGAAVAVTPPPDHDASPWAPPRETAAPRRAPAAARRPGERRASSPMVLGILYLVFGGLGLLGNGINLLKPGDDDELFGPTVALLIRVEYVWGLLAAVALLVLGTGLVNYREWARRGAVAFAWLCLVVTALDLVIAIPLLQHGMDIFESRHQFQQVDRGAVMGGMAIATLISLPLPIVSLCLLGGNAAYAACNPQPARSHRRAMAPPPAAPI